MDAKKRERPATRYIPFRKKDIVEMCIASGGLAGKEQMQFRQLCEVLKSVYHFEYHQKLERLKDAYAPLNPDRDTRKVGFYTENQEAGFIAGLDELLDKANYEALSETELKHAMEESSLFQLKLHIDFDEFEEVLLYTRGESIRREEVKQWYGLRKQIIEFPNFDRVVIYIRFKKELKDTKLQHKPGSTMLKLFQNVPKADVEMLFPNTRLGMRTIDKLMIAVPALLGSGAIFTTKVGPSLLLFGGLLGYWFGISSEPVKLDQGVMLAIVIGVVGLGSYIWKQFVNFKNRKLTYMQTLTESLYFKNLDNNAGVFHRLVDDAEEEECKEAILGYYFLLTKSDLNTVSSLDEGVEAWFKERWDCALDYEVEDALAKLFDLGLISEADGQLKAIDMDTACQKLDKRWDDYFVYNQR